MTTKKTTQSRRKYDSAFKEEVLKMVASGRPIAEISQSLGIGENLIYRWKKLHGFVKNSSTNLPSDAQQDLIIELDRVKADLRRTEQERDILKKALGIFSRGI